MKNVDPQKIILELKDYGLSQTEISERSGVPQPTISRIKNGKYQHALFENVRQLWLLLDSVKRSTRRRRKAAA